MKLPSLLRKKSNLLYLLLVLLILLIVLILRSSFFKSSVQISVTNPLNQTDLDEVAKIRQECFEMVGKITEKDATRFNEFRSLADFRLYKYRECLREKGVTESF